MLGFVDNLNILGNSLDDTVGATEALELTAQRIGLHINIDKIKLMQLLDIGTSLDVLETLPYKSNIFSI